MKKTLNFRHLLLIGFGLLLTANSCQKGFDADSLKTGGEKALTGPTCHLHVPDYDDYGKLLYDYLKYNVAIVKPEEMFPTSFRQQTKDAFDSAKSQTAGMDLTAKMNFLTGNGSVSTAFSTEYLNFVSDVSAMISAGTGIDDVINQIKARELTLDLSSLSCDEQEVILAVHSATRYLLLYLSEIWGNNGETYFTGDGVQDRGCSFGEALGCTFSSFGAFILSAAAFAVDPPAGFLLITIAILEGGLDFVEGVNEFKDCCNNLNCRAPRAVSLRFNNCTASAVYTASGFGSDDVSLSWFNMGGTPPFTSTLTSAPTVTITQTSPSTAVTTTIISNCSDGSINPTIAPFVINLSTRVLQVTGISIAGITRVYPPDGVLYTYSAFGLNGSSNYSAQWSVTNGTIVSSTNSTATVLWDATMTEGVITLKVTNNCPGGAIADFPLTVTADGDQE
ncbi:MAG TPA: hypothetical protein ENJ95_05925 [Bacteroidetes bacterium]|nr:hypothetical protein [Bacteroidota bacterium]